MDSALHRVRHVKSDHRDYAYSGVRKRWSANGYERLALDTTVRTARALDRLRSDCGESVKSNGAARAQWPSQLDEVPRQGY